MMRGFIFFSVSASLISSETETGLNSFFDWNRSSLSDWFITIEPSSDDTERWYVFLGIFKVFLGILGYF